MSQGRPRKSSGSSRAVRALRRRAAKGERSMSIRGAVREEGERAKRGKAITEEEHSRE